MNRIPPYNDDAEKCVLGSILLDPQRLDAVALIVSRADFYNQAHQTIFEHMVICRERLDLAILLESLKGAEQLENIGGASYFARLIDHVGTPFNAKHFATVVRDLSRKRGIAEVGEQLYQAAHDPQADADSCIEQLQSSLTNLLDTSNAAEVLSGSDLANLSMEELDRRRDGGGNVGVMTGWPDVDEILCGLRPGQLIIVAARPSIGKSAFCQNVAEYAAGDQVKTLCVSLEMAALECGDRLLSSIAGVDSFRIRVGRVTTEQYSDLTDAARQLATMPLSVIDKPLTVEGIESYARRQKNKAGLGLLVVDYLQLVDTPENERVREREVAKISRSLKRLAQNLQIPVICAAQLNRSAAEERPKLSHLRESGSIEQDADIVILLHRPSETEPAEIVIAKNRNGPIHTVKLLWRKEFTRFDSLSTQQP